MGAGVRRSSRRMPPPLLAKAAWRSHATLCRRGEQVVRPAASRPGAIRVPRRRLGGHLQQSPSGSLSGDDRARPQSASCAKRRRSAAMFRSCAATSPLAMFWADASRRRARLGHCSPLNGIAACCHRRRSGAAWQGPACDARSRRREKPEPPTRLLLLLVR